MSKSPYGLTALMETINKMESEEKEKDLIDDVITSSTESMTYMDAVEAGFLDEEGVDDEMEDVEDEVDPDDPEINRMLDEIDPTDDEDEDVVNLENLDLALESYIEQNYY
jgi:hypothetical protein